MATLQHLTNGFLNLSHDERFNLIRNIRALRRTPIERPKAKSKSSPRASKPKKDLLSNLTPEQAQQLLEMLGE